MHEKILTVIAENFPNGARYDFITDKKIRRYYAEKFGEEIPADFKIEAVLERHCVKHGGKFYLMHQLDKEKILNLVDEIISDNVIIFYTKFYEKHRDFFAELKIFSAEVLRETLQTMDYRYIYDEDYFAMGWFITPQDLLKKYFKTHKEISLDEVEEIFPYIPLEVVKKILSSDKNILAKGAGKYILANSIQFDENEIQSARTKISAEIKRTGHAILDSSKFPRTLELNPDVAETNLYAAIYEKFLSDKFSKNKNILTPKGKKIDATTLIKNFCAERDEVTVDELLNYALEVGVKKSSIHYHSLDAAYKVMVRVSKDLFVRDTLIDFDVDGVDSALNSFVQKKIIALQDVNDFSTFPPVDGYSWNLYLLESFLRKFSRRYVFDTTTTNNSLCGAIYPKSMKFEDYVEVQAAVILQEKIPRDEKNIAEFLIGRGFRKTKNKSALKNILEVAREI